MHRPDASLRLLLSVQKPHLNTPSAPVGLVASRSYVPLDSIAPRFRLPRPAPEYRIAGHHMFVALAYFLACTRHIFHYPLRLTFLIGRLPPP